MAAKKGVEEIKEALTKKKVVIGTIATIKKIKLGAIAKVYMSNNCPEDVKEDIERYAKFDNIEVAVLDKNNEELGIVCRKPFMISILGILGEKKAK
jgi:large subunit ribosomal protein L30e